MNDNEIDSNTGLPRPPEIVLLERQTEFNKIIAIGTIILAIGTFLNFMLVYLSFAKDLKEQESGFWLLISIPIIFFTIIMAYLMGVLLTISLQKKKSKHPIPHFHFPSISPAQHSLLNIKK